MKTLAESEDALKKAVRIAKDIRSQELRRMSRETVEEFRAAIKAIRITKTANQKGRICAALPVENLFGMKTPLPGKSKIANIHRFVDSVEPRGSYTGTVSVLILRKRVLIRKHPPDGGGRCD